MQRPFGKLFEDHRGVAMVELAMFAPVLALLVIGIVDLSNAYNRKFKVEQAAQLAVEKVMQTTGTTTIEDTIIKEAATQAGVPASDVAVKYRLECDQMVVANASASCAAGQKEARYIEVVVNDKYTPIFPIHFMGINSDGTYHITAKAGMRIQ